MEYILFFISLIITLLFIAWTGYYPGGIIVPAYLVLFIDQPIRLLGTILVAIVSWLIYRLISRYFIIYGKRRFVLLLILGATFSFILSYIVPQFIDEAVELKVIGWIIPGLIANQLEKQGLKITLASISIVLFILYIFTRLFYLVF